jgi:hypothetical protein
MMSSNNRLANSYGARAYRYLKIAGEPSPQMIAKGMMSVVLSSVREQAEAQRSRSEALPTYLLADESTLVVGD